MHHVTTRSIAEEHIFRDSGDYAACITIFASLVDEGFFVCHAFCIMPTHYHLYCTFANVSTAIHKLNRRYAKKFNKRYGRRGHVFDSPFSRTEVTTESHYLELPRYIALNPRDYETWPYSSYPGLIGKREPFSFVDPSPIIDAFGSVESFRAYVDEGRAAEDANLVVVPGDVVDGLSREKEPHLGLRCRVAIRREGSCSFMLMLLSASASGCVWSSWSGGARRSLPRRG
jgi:REP element-mobilizing transposase RayT